MQNAQELQESIRLNHWWKVIIGDKWMIVLSCVLLMIVGNMLANQRQLVSETNSTITIDSDVAQGEKLAPSIAVATLNGEPLSSKPSIWPANGQVTSGFGWRGSPFGAGSELHPGIDIANVMGMPIVATADGEVVQSDLSDSGYGNLIKINHSHGIETLYGHNSSLLVKVGDHVKKGQIISYLGSTGMSTGPHVHYEIRVNGVAVDPMAFLVQY